MGEKVGGQRPRPRVALLGDFPESDVRHFKNMFPTIWSAKNQVELKEKVDIREIDLIVIAPNIDWVRGGSKETHVICFSNETERLPGPLNHSYVRISGLAETEEFVFPDIPLPLSRLREADFRSLSSVRGWQRLEIEIPLPPPAGSGGPGGYLSNDEREEATRAFNQGRIIFEARTKKALAIYFMRKDCNLGVAWLPMISKNYASWVEVLVAEWAKLDKEAFPSFGDWTSSPEWLVYDEEKIITQIKEFEQQKRESIVKIDEQITKLINKLAEVKLEANNGLRRLITAQGSELLDEVAKGLDSIGFTVDFMDEQIGQGEQKKEDLRLKHVDKEGKEWVAIVEVRGYARSGGTTADLLRLSRFADMYKIETGKYPDSRIYIVNGELEQLPSARQEPLISAKDDLKIFAESNGVLIWSVDLFRTLKAAASTDYPHILESIKCSQGRWVPNLKKK
jgi:hypothetical protein